MNTNKSDIVCSSCDRQKFELKARKSKLLPGQSLYLCNECIAKRLEPRWVVIMAGRRYSPEYVKDYLHPKRYIGEEILLKEIT